MYRITLFLLASVTFTALAQIPTANLPLNIQQLRQLVEKNPIEKQTAVLSQTLQSVVARIQALKSQEPNNPELVDLIELRILVSPIAVLVKKSATITTENCLQAQHEIEYMENFAEQEQRNSSDGTEAVALLKLFCSKIDKK